jgi:soluble lytic murein transglycosylase-like protein
MKKFFFVLAGAFAVGAVMNREKIIGFGITKYDPLFLKYGKLYSVDPQILKKIAYIESTLGLNPRVALGLLFPEKVNESKSYDGLSWGLMQIRPETARQFDPAATAEKLNDAEYSIKIAAQYMSWAKNYLIRFLPATDPRFVEFWVKSYNQGVGNTRNEILNKTNGFAGAYWSKFKKALA